MSTQKAPKGNIRDYILSKKSRYKFTFTYEGITGLSYYTVHGQRMEADHFNQLFPNQIESSITRLDGRQI